MLDLIVAKSGEILLQYRFKNTNSNVYSMEEAVYIAYNNFYVYFDEILSENFLKWLSSMKLNNIVKSIRDCLANGNQIDGFISFLELSKMYSKEEIYKLKEEIEEFYENSKFLQYKKIAYEYAKINNLNYSIKFYLGALEQKEDFDVLSNLGYLNLASGSYNTAKMYLEKAYENKKDKYIVENLLKCYVELEDMENVKNILKISEKILDIDVYTFYIGELSYLEKNYENQISFYLEALSYNYKKQYILKIIDFYIKNRKYKKGNDFINSIVTNDVDLIIKMAQSIHVSESAQKACSFLEEQSIKNPFDIKILVSISKYKRLCYDVTGARQFLELAKAIDNKNNFVLLEEARLNKAIGNQVEYTDGIKEILNDLKDTYRLTY